MVQALHGLLLRAGVTVELNVDIEEITLSRGLANGAIAKCGKIFKADRVICNGDPPTVYAQMLPADGQKRRRLASEKLTHYSMGLYVLFFGTKRQYPDVAHHTIWMGPRYKELLKDIFEKNLI